MTPEVVSFTEYPGSFRVRCYQCEHVDCSCTEVTFELRELRERDSRAERPRKIVIRVDVPTWQETDPPKRSPAIATAVAEFLRDYPESEREWLMSWYGERERIVRQLGECRIDPREVEKGTLVDFREILAPPDEPGWSCPLGEYSVDCDDAEYIVIERFCPNPDCRCRSVTLAFLRRRPDPDAEGTCVAEEEFTAALSLEGEVKLDKVCGINESFAERVLAQWQQENGSELERVTWRYEKIKEIGGRSMAMRRVDAAGRKSKGPKEAFFTEEFMFDIHQSVFDADGEWDEGLAEEYCDGLMTAFAESPEGAAFEKHYGEIGWPQSFLYYGQSYLGTTPPEMSRRDVAEILFELFPRKVSVEAEAAGEIIAEMRAFWEFLGRQYELPNAAGILADLGRDAKARLKRELSDSSNFGMAKSFFTMGQDAGFDMTNEAGMAQFTMAYNEALRTAQGGLPDESESGFDEPADSTNPVHRSFNVTPELRQQRKKQRRKSKQRKSKRNRR